MDRTIYGDCRLAFDEYEYYDTNESQVKSDIMMTQTHLLFKKLKLNVN